MRLIERNIKRLSPPKSGYFIAWDDELTGLGVRVTAAGTKSFIVNYRTSVGRQRRATIGKFPAISATAARLRAQELLASVTLGSDPVKKEQERRDERTLGALVDKYQSGHLVNLSSGDEVARYLRSEFLPQLGAKTKVSAVTRWEIADLVIKKAVRAPVASNRLLTHIKGLFGWGIAQGLIKEDPAAGVRRAAPKEISRDRRLSPEEIRRVWDALASAHEVSAGVLSALRLILITAQRPGEVAGMRWDELDIPAGMWNLPAERTKARRRHEVPLSRLALAEIERQGRGDEWVFPGPAGQHISTNALAHAVRRTRDRLGIPRWTPHDLRRTATTQLAKLGVDRFMLGLILNHADDSETAKYDRYAYEDEKRQALAKWDRRLQAIISGEAPAKVVAIDG